MLLGSILTLLTAGMMAQDAQFTREKDSFVWTHAGIVPVTPRMKIVVRGNVRIDGTNDDRITYKIVQRAKARNEGEARRMFGSLFASVARAEGGSTFALRSTAAAGVVNDIDINLPRGLA